MDKVLYRASILSNFIYIIVGVFGYLTFSESKEVTYEQLQAPKRSKDILEADYGKRAGFSINVSQFLIMLAVICASPLAVLPAK